MAGKITALKVQKRNPNRVNIYLDGEFAFGAARIVAAWLQIGQELDDRKIAEIQSQDAREVAYQNALILIGYRPRAEAEVRRRLAEKGFDESVIDEVLQRLKAGGLIGDAGFARTWIENRSEFRPRSHRALTFELRQKGVGEEEITQALEDAAGEDQLAYEAARRQAKRLETLEWDVFRARLSGFLGRRGFAYATVAPVVRRVWQELQTNRAPNEKMEEG